MFFYLSKIFSFLISPISWIAVFLLVALFAKDARRKKRSLITAAVLLLFISNSFILDEFIRAWEIEVVKYGKEKPHDIGIVLGGGVTYDAI
ncbi:MAG: YdcF family protein, partial [Bacteroidia bacterium]